MWKRVRKFIKRHLLADSSRNESQTWLWGLFFTVTTLAYASLLVEHAQRLWVRDYFQFYPVFAAGVLYLTFQRFREGELPAKRTWRIEPVSMFIGIAIVPVAHWITSPWLAAASFWLIGNSLLCGNRKARQSWRMLALLIPLPLGRDHQFIQKLQQISAVKASILLDACQVPHRMRGNVLELADKHFFVEEACSGISSVYLILATTLFCLVWHQARAIRAVPLLLSVFWWAIVANVMRISSIASAHFFWGVDLSSGIFHELTGMGTLCFAFGMVYLTKQFLDFLFGEAGDGKAMLQSRLSLELTPTVLWNLFTVNDLTVAHGTHPKPPLGVNVHRKLMLYSLSTILFISFTTNLGFAYFPALRKAVAPGDNANTEAVTQWTAPVEALNAALFSELEHVETLDFKPTAIDSLWKHAPTSKISRQWTLRCKSEESSVNIDGPFEGWQNLRSLYEKEGWKITDATTSAVGSTSFNKMVSLQLVDYSGRAATLHYCHFDTSGNLLEIPQQSSHSLSSNIRNRLATETKGNNSVWQFRMLTMQSGQAVVTLSEVEGRLFQELLWQTLDRWRDSQ